MQAPRPRFELPPTSDAAAWTTISDRLQIVCAGVADDQSGARGIDTLHAALASEMTHMGLLSAPIKIQAPHMPRSPFSREVQQIRSIIKTAQKRTKRDPAARQEARAAAKIKEALSDAIGIENTTRLTRKHHKMASTNPKKLADAIWGRSMSSEPPDCSKEHCAQFFSETFAEFKPPDNLPSWLPQQCGPLPLHALTITPLMVQKTLAKKGTKQSAPGLDGITYGLLHRLPWIPKVLAELFNKIIAQQVCPEVWRYGLTVLLHKGGPKDLPNYRPITLSPTISKIFHSIVASWLEKALTASSIIPTKIQKGFLLGVSGAVEHDLVIDAALGDAKKHRKNFYMLLVDLKNAFGSVPHERIAWALHRFGVPDWVRLYIDNFYGDVHTKMHCKAWETDFLQVRRGVLQGDTLSPLLFLLVMQVALHALGTACPDYGYRASSDGSEHFLKCFADDLTIVTRNPKRLQLAVQKLEEITQWLGLEIKPSKCRTFGMAKGTYRKIDIDIVGHTVLNVEDAASKFLGMQLSLTQTFREKAEIARKAILDIVRPLDQFPLPGRDKVQLYKNFAIPKMRWILLVQDVLPTALRSITTETEQHLKKWWHLPRGTSRDALRLVTGIPSISDVADQAQCTKYYIARASTDPNVASVLSYRKTHKHKPVDRLMKTLGCNIPKSRREAMNKIKEEQGNALRAKVGKLLVQGAWMELGRSLATDRQWRSMMWSLPSAVQQFATKAAIDVLPTRANLLRWKVGCNASCENCGVKETLHHTLNHCVRLLNSGAYKWRHDSVLQHLLHCLLKRYPEKSITADLPGRTYQLPFHCDTDWRPDIIIHNKTDHTIEFVELTVPFEANTKAAHTRKTTKYSALMECAKADGLRAKLSCVEMGSRGIPSPHWDTWVKEKGLPRNVTKLCSAIALCASHVVWLHKNTTWPNPPLLDDPWNMNSSHQSTAIRPSYSPTATTADLSTTSQPHPQQIQLYTATLSPTQIGASVIQRLTNTEAHHPQESLPVACHVASHFTTVNRPVASSLQENEDGTPADHPEDSEWNGGGSGPAVPENSKALLEAVFSLFGAPRARRGGPSSQSTTAAANSTTTAPLPPMPPQTPPKPPPTFCTL